MKPSLLAAAIAIASFAGSARADVTIIDNNQTAEIDCARDPAVSLVGNHITITTKGVCASISVSGNHAKVTGSAVSVQVLGNHNLLTLAAADDVSVAGNHNKATVQKGVKRKAPRISNVGRDNQITQVK